MKRTRAEKGAMSAIDPGRPSSAGRCGGENRQLSIESTLEGLPRFATGDIGREVRIFLQQTRSVQPAQDRHHHQVTGAERIVEPVGIAKPTGKFAQPYTDAILEDRQSLPIPNLVVLQERGDSAINNRRLHRAKRGKHPCDRARPGIRIVRQQPRMALRDMEYDRPRLEESEIAFFIGRNLPERMKRTMRGFLHLAERNKTNAIGLAHFFKRPANAHVTCLSLAAVGRPFKGCDGGGHWKAPGNCRTLSRVVCVITTIFSWLGIRFLRFSSRGRTTGADPDNLPRFPWPWDFAVRAFCARRLPANDLKPFRRRRAQNGTYPTSSAH